MNSTSSPDDIHTKTHRTRGLWIFDHVLYNLTNISVLALSVYATYKTNYSQPKETPLELQNWWMKRGSQCVRAFQKTGMNEESARNANMVLWSFLDGSVIAPFVAMLEHRRNKIGKWIDDKLHTHSDDPHIYQKQPHEGWKSVLLGRLASFSVVMPTFFLMKAKDNRDPKSLSLNNILFDKTAEAIVEHNVAGLPGFLHKRFPKLDVGGLAKTTVFELFYSTLTTTVLFMVSYIAGKREHEKYVLEKQEEARLPAPAVSETRRWGSRNPQQRPASHAERLSLNRASPQALTI